MISEDEKVQAMEKASEIMRKYKNKSHFNTHPRSKDSWLIHKIKRIVQSPNRMINPHKYKFENSREAAKFNTKLLKKHKYDLEIALNKEKGTMLEPGSEFRTKDTIEPLFQNHELWPKMKEIVQQGITYHLESITKRSTAKTSNI